MLTRCRLALVGPNAVQRRGRSSPRRAAASSASVSSSPGPPRFSCWAAAIAPREQERAVDRQRLGIVGRHVVVELGGQSARRVGRCLVVLAAHQGVGDDPGAGRDR